LRLVVGPLVEAREEESSKVVCAGSGNGLDTEIRKQTEYASSIEYKRYGTETCTVPCDTAFCNRGRVSPKNEFGSGAGVFWKTGNGQIFVIECGVIEQDLGCLEHDTRQTKKNKGPLLEALVYLFDNRENPWLAVVVTVGTYTEVHFLRKGVGLV
jgi:hypothetical protein